MCQSTPPTLPCLRPSRTKHPKNSNWLEKFICVQRPPSEKEFLAMTLYATFFKSPRSVSRLVGLGCFFISVLAFAQQAIKFDAATISGLPARNIGSATMSGRVAAGAAVAENGRLTVFVGAASGGVWKSVNGGTTFKPVFDRQSVQSIGAVAIDPSNSRIVWGGSGEAWTRNSVSIGDGIYKSTDGGENWVNMGLKDTEHIAKILIDPQDGNNVLACVN